MRKIIVTGSLPETAHIKKHHTLDHSKLVSFLKSVIVQSEGSQVFGILNPGQYPAFAQAAIALKDAGYPVSLICGICESDLTIVPNQQGASAYSHILKRADAVMKFKNGNGRLDSGEWVLSIIQDDPFGLVIALRDKKDEADVYFFEQHGVDVLSVDTNLFS